jgi:cell cycle related kinase
MENYVVLSKIGEGTFGEVYKAKHRRSGCVVALKKVRTRNMQSDGLSKNLFREIKALELLDARHVVQLIEYFPYGAAIVIAFEFMLTDLHRVMRTLGKRGETFAEAQVKCIASQLLRGVAAVHAASLMHRDLKPANILFAADGSLKLGDFGLARVHRLHAGTGSSDLYSHEVATRWYRAPELLFGARRYDHGVDLWAVGCIIAELVSHAPLFPGENDIDQLHRVMRQLGTPDAVSWPEAASLPDFDKIHFPAMPAVPLALTLSEAPPCAVELVESFVVYQPRRRCGALNALRHPYFFTPPLAKPLDIEALLCAGGGNDAGGGGGDGDGGGVGRHQRGVDARRRRRRQQRQQTNASNDGDGDVDANAAGAGDGGGVANNDAAFAFAAVDATPFYAAGVFDYDAPLFADDGFSL